MAEFLACYALLIFVAGILIGIGIAGLAADPVQTRERCSQPAQRSPSDANS